MAAPGVFDNRSEKDTKRRCIVFEKSVKSRDIDTDQNGMSMLNMIHCQKCGTNFSSKDQYHEHQCEFDVEKLVMKPSPGVGNGKPKFECSTCSRSFTTKNYLERHQISHEDLKINTCEHCKKQYVSEAALKIHLPTCKKARKITKLYRTDMTVWKCRKCTEVFSSNSSAAYHADTCSEGTDIIMKDPLTETENNHIETIEKVSTEILLQCEFCNRIYVDKQTLLKHQKSHKTDKNYECVICNEVFTSYVDASQHWSIKCSEIINPFYLPKLTYCEVCDKTFKSHDVLYTHKIQLKHFTSKIHESVTTRSNQVKDIKQEDAMEDGSIATEQQINKRRNIESNDDKENIQLSSSGENLTVKTEPLSLFNFDSNLPEKNETLNNEYKYTRECCTEIANDNNENIQPSTSRELIKSKTEPLSPFNLDSNFSKKNKGLNEEFKYQCERCTEIWNSITELESHRKMKHAAYFNCSECEKVFPTAMALLVHTRSAHNKNVKPYVCNTCGKDYYASSHLEQHIWAHQGIKPFACSFEGCEARYKNRPNLMDHIRNIHTREKPYKCSDCEKRFSKGSDYYEHRNIHTQNRRYKCHICEKQFLRYGSLINHNKTHTTEKP